MDKWTKAWQGTSAIQNMQEREVGQSQPEVSLRQKQETLSEKY
jgi:hypothetical protein